MQGLHEEVTKQSTLHNLKPGSDPAHSQYYHSIILWHKVSQMILIPILHSQHHLYQSRPHEHILISNSPEISYLLYHFK